MGETHVKEEQAEKKEEPTEEKKPEEPQEIVLKVEMHCQACAKKVEKSLLRFEGKKTILQTGVENVKADSRSKTVVVKSRTADPAKVCERVQRKTKRRVELISPLPPPPPPEEEKKEEAPPAPPEEKKEEPAKTTTVILKVRMHCDACAQILQKRISKIDGVESVVTDLSTHQVIVQGAMGPAVLVDNIQRKTRRPAAIVEGEKGPEEEKKPDEETKEEEKKDDGDDDKGGAIQLNKYEFWPPIYVEYVNPYYLPASASVPDEFGDENPNACAIV